MASSHGCRLRPLPTMCGGRIPISLVGLVELFGASEHAESMTILRPGEWIRVSANVKLFTSPSGPVSAHLKGDFWLRRNTFHPHAGGQFIEARSLYPNTTPTPVVAVSFLTTAATCQSSSLYQSGSSTQKRPHEKRGHGLIQNESDLLDTDLLPWDARSDRVPPLQTIIFNSFPGRTPVTRLKCLVAGSCQL